MAGLLFRGFYRFVLGGLNRDFFGSVTQLDND